MPKILVIDDHAEIRDLCAEVLAEAGHEVLMAGDGSLGLALYARHRPEVVITDLQLPGVPGLEIIARLGRDPGVHIIAMSGGARENLEAARRLGAARAFRKPFDVDHLAGVVGGLACGTPGRNVAAPR